MKKNYHLHKGEQTMGNEERTPIKVYRFPAGECGAEIRINIPAFASKDDVEMAAAMMQVVADKWTKPE